MRPAEALARRLLFAFDPETAHGLALQLMRWTPGVRQPTSRPRLATELFGLSFPNPVGLAAGFDKSGVLGEAALRFGFGFTEVGTLTPRPQPGNPRPRVFRLTADQGVINRYGFNNDGHAAAHARLRRRPRCGIVGINVGANKDAGDRTADYVAGLRAFADVADYFTLNVSSPNTPGLRDLQAAQALDDLLARTVAARDELAALHGRKPVLLKIAPDLGFGALDDIVAVACRRGVDGLIVSNTTVSRPDGLRAPEVGQAGGLSGRPLFGPSTRLLAETYRRVQGQFPLIGVGGVDSPARALEKIRAGASLLQLYSGLVFEGLGLVERINAHLDAVLAADALTFPQLVGQDVHALAEGQ